VTFSGFLTTSPSQERLVATLCATSRATLAPSFPTPKQQGYFDGENPARNTAIPPSRPSEETYAYVLRKSRRFFRCYLNRRTVFAVAALRVRGAGEIRGLLWENYRENEIQVARSIWCGHVTTQNARARGYSRNTAARQCVWSPSTKKREAQLRG